MTAKQSTNNTRKIPAADPVMNAYFAAEQEIEYIRYDLVGEGLTERKHLEVPLQILFEELLRLDALVAKHRSAKQLAKFRESSMPVFHALGDAFRYLRDSREREALVTEFVDHLDDATDYDRSAPWRWLAAFLGGMLEPLS